MNSSHTIVAYIVREIIEKGIMCGVVESGFLVVRGACGTSYTYTRISLTHNTRNTSVYYQLNTNYNIIIIWRQICNH